MHHELGHVRETPARRGQIERDPLLLTAEEDDVVEAPHLEESRPPHDDAAGQKAEDRRPRQVDGPTERGGGHRRTDRIIDLGGPDLHASRDDGDPRVGVEHLDRSSQ